MDEAAAYQDLKTKLADRWWRLSHLYKIQDTRGQIINFKPNAAQENLYRDLHYFNVVLKARQLGFSTFILLMLLDAALFNSNTACGVIAHTREDAEKLFSAKIKFPYDNLPSWLKEHLKARNDRANELVFANGSQIRCGTSFRGGTLQMLHISEYGKISARYPEKAREIRTGALNAVHAGQIIFVESTAEGAGGDFFELCREAQGLQDAAADLTTLDPKMHFFPWFAEPTYRLDNAGIVLSREDEAYFAKIEAETGRQIDRQQRAWYVRKQAQMRDDMAREFPSTPAEAFEAKIEGAYFGNEMTAARREGRITRLPIEAGVPVYTFWDLGLNDFTSIWLMQPIGRERRFIGYYQNNGESLAHYAAWLDDWARRNGVRFGEHYLPHDVGVSELGSFDPVTKAPRSRRRVLEELGVKPLRVVPRVSDIRDAIHISRKALSSCWFDPERCAEGIKALDTYQREWDDKRGVAKDYPRHDAASHGASAFAQFARGFRPDRGPNRKPAQARAEAYEPHAW